MTEYERFKKFIDGYDWEGIINLSYALQIQECKEKLNKYNKQMSNPKAGKKSGSASTDKKLKKAAGLNPFKVNTKKK